MKIQIPAEYRCHGKTYILSISTKLKKKKKTYTTKNILGMIVEHVIHNCRDFPGGAVVRNPPANAGDKGLSPAPGRSNMSRSN